jgi:site-specific recombinase XerD
MHYLAILSNPENYDHVPAEDRPEFVNGILERLGYNTVSVRYAYLIRENESYCSRNMEVILPKRAYTSRTTRIKAFIHWMDSNGREWYEPDLLHYKHYLRQEGASLEYINNLLHILRKRYKELKEDEELLATLDDETREDFLSNYRRRLGYHDSYPNRENASREMVEDDPYNKNWLTVLQERALMQQPDPDTLVGRRDRALLALVLTTAVQQFEAARVQVEHLRHELDGQPALYVPESKVREARLIPYDDTYPLLEWMDAWLEIAEIDEGPVFRGTYGNTSALRPYAIKPETATDILGRYPIVINGYPVSLFFSDLRSTCARRWYKNGISLDEIARRTGLTRWPMLSMMGLRMRDIYT